MIEILIVHSSDYGNEIQVFVDGEDVTNTRDVYVVEVDAGAGWWYEDWQESAKAAFEGGRWPKFCTAVAEAFADPPNREYIHGWPEDECPAGGEHRSVPDSDENNDMRTFSSRSFHCEECGVSLPNPQQEEP